MSGADPRAVLFVARSRNNFECVSAAISMQLCSQTATAHSLRQIPSHIHTQPVRRTLWRYHSNQNTRANYSYGSRLWDIKSFSGAST